MTILLVEDHRDTREALERLLKKRGHIVHGASDMRSALDLAREKPFDLLMCDLQLPDGDGYQLLETLQSEGDVLALAMSGHCTQADLARSKTAGFFTHVIKPYGIDEVQSAIDAAQAAVERRSGGG
jgi:two-component system NtrC family sensor kinase